MSNYTRTPEQQKLVEEMLKLRREYYDKVDEMWKAFKPCVTALECYPSEAIEYLNECVPDCVPRVLAINYYIDIIEESVKE